MSFVTAPFAAQAPYFRREFTADQPPGRAVLRVSGLGIVEPYLNGTRVGDEVLAPGWTSYRHRVQVSAYDVTALIKAGGNALGAIVGEGWASGRLGFEGKDRHYTDRPALYMRLELTYGPRTEVIVTDEQWTAGTGAVLAASLYDGETYDARLEPERWQLPGFPGDWLPVEPLGWSLDTLVPTVADPIRRIEELAPVSLETRGARTIVDFGQILTGWVKVRTTGEAGQSVTIRHAELLKNGELDVETLRSAKATDTYVHAGGTAVWEPRFTFHGFRYAEIDGPFDEVAAVVVHSDMRRTGWLDTSHEPLDRLHANAVRSMRGNFVGVPTDCPQRDERLGWTGDLNAFAPTAAFLYDVRAVLGSWLEDLAAEQREKGYVPWVVPDVLSAPSSPTALWSDVAVGLPWALYQEYGDTGILRRGYDSMASFVRDVETRLDENGLWSSGFQFGDWLDPDAPPDNPAGGKTDRHLVAAAYLARTTREMADTAGILGKGDDVAHFRALADKVRAAFRAEYVTAHGRVAGESATAYALAICFGLLDPAQEVKAGKRLAELVAKTGYKISTGFAGTPLLLPALSRTGHLTEAYLLLMETGCPSFLYPVSMGASTIWERWDAILPDGTLNSTGMTSLNHYALGAVCDWLHKTVGGLSPLEPGYRRMLIAPRPGGGLTHATLRHWTVHGDVRVTWRIGERFVLEVTIPDGTHAVVGLPDGETAEISGGSHTFTCEPPRSYGSREPYSMDTSLKTLAADPAVWRELTEVFAKHLPGIPIDGNAPEAAAFSLNTVLEFIPGASDELRDDLKEAIA
ncbi:alpha-L-rhamnosidase [Nonomuraea sp. SBT364]|uniref:alpha-L-rhamnosidase n=1 Tax=Nonomuraea sp. SBT364 TaxID=1580530 RepID=UPI00066AD603|nr:alpha-L-rhamnosidase [Nonomuraea sp. SBT364]